MRLFQALTLFVAVSVLTSAGCTASNPKASNRSLSRCQESLNTIPQVGALIKPRKDEAERPEGRPLEGMVLALTINGMVLSEVDPEAGDYDWCYKENNRENFDKLIKALKDNEMPPTVDFVVGSSYDRSFQEEWLGAGNLIGNMGYERQSVRKAGSDEIIENISRNDQILNDLWKKYPQKNKYFRYPRLKSKGDLEKRRVVNAFIRQRGYSETPGTIDARDALFSQVYCEALNRGDKECVDFIKATYISLLLDTAIKARSTAAETAGRDIKHVLMVRACQFTCDMLGDILRWFKTWGARFVTVDEVLGDPFYANEDVGNIASTIIKKTQRAQTGKDESE
jgi:hypothetical protein